MYEAGLFDKLVVIFSELKSVKFIKPVYPKSTISATVRIIESYPSKNKKGNYLTISVAGFECKNKEQFIAFDAKFKILTASNTL